MNQLRVLTVVVCGAGPASQVGRLIEAAHAGGWTVRVIATPAALDFLDLPKIEALAGTPVVSQYRRPDEARTRTLPDADAYIVAPATYNTIAKLAAGISDNYALGILAEAIGRGVPVVILPFVNSALAGRAPFARAVAQLRDEGVHILFGQGEWEPHPPGTGGARIEAFPWSLALNCIPQTR